MHLLPLSWLDPYVAVYCACISFLDRTRHQAADPEAVRDYRDQLERAGRTPATIYTAINDTRLEQAIDERSRRRRGAQRAAASN